MLLTFPKPDMWAELIAMAVGTVTWHSTVLVVGLLTAWSVVGLLAEWQARRTPVAFARTAPTRLIMIHQNTSTGHALWLIWEADPDQRRRRSRT